MFFALEARQIEMTIGFCLCMVGPVKDSVEILCFKDQCLNRPPPPPPTHTHQTHYLGHMNLKGLEKN
jgi:hypothetical protein